MSRRVAIVGSGMMGATLAWALAARGVEVIVFEKGPDYPYPHAAPFAKAVLYDHADPAYNLDPGLRRITHSGDYGADLGREAVMRVGGSGTVWTALATRMTPGDFRVRTRCGFGDDWPIGYDDLEPWFGRAETLLGVAGTDADNPWAPPRSTPYPLPPFALTPDDAWFAGRLAAAGLHVHTTPQARARRAWDGRPACMNVGECQACPSGARYSPTHHLLRAVATGRCRVFAGAAVRRVLTDAAGRATGVLVRAPGGARDEEHPADLVVVAAGAIESARLLLLSRDARHPDGLGNASGHVGRHLAFHHIWTGHVHFRERVMAGQVGFWTGQSDQFCDPPGRGRHGGVKIECPSRTWPGHRHAAGEAASLEEAMALFEPTTRCRQIGMHAESTTSPGKFVTLSAERDAFGDPLAHVHYAFDAFDAATYEFARSLFDRVARAAGAVDGEFPGPGAFNVFAHYMGTHRMSVRPADGVVDPCGRVHDTPRLWAVGLGMFVGSGGAVNPTLAGIALALRAADAMAGDLGA
uniref:GMC family oxidoreductase n=1 Tax=Eiseniibacteriota bacterium TaxID=2212470 RepID=A0A832I3A5_UNCEI